MGKLHGELLQNESKQPDFIISVRPGSKREDERKRFKRIGVDHPSWAGDRI
jgi:hypothetical protein